MDSKGMLIGEKGVKYGLQKPAPKKPVGQPIAKPKPANVFGADSDSDEDVGAQVARQAEKKRAAAKVQQMYEAALTDDPSIFDYDGVYDSIQQARVQPKQQEKIERKSRYIAQLKDQAEQRKRESDIAFERKALKDRVKEDHLFSDKEVFVTGAYRRKLEEQQKWMEDQKRKEEEEQRQDVRKIGHMGNFYANLLSSNVAFGTAAAPPTKGEDKSFSPGPAGPSSDRQTPRTGPEPEGGDRAGSRDEEEPSEEALVAAAAKAGVSLDKYELMRLQAEKALKQQPRPGGGTAGGSAGNADRPQGQAPPGGAAGPEQDGEAGALGAFGAADTAEGTGDQGGEEAPAPTAQAAKRRNDDTSVQSAKERYLARKKQATGQA